LLGIRGVKIRKLSVFLLFLIAVSFVNSHAFGRFLIEEPFRRGEFGNAYVTIRNNFDRDMDDVNVKFLIYDLGLISVSGSSDVEDDDHVMQRISMYIPRDVPAGDYLTKITVGNDDFRDTQHVYLRIV